MPSNAMQSVQTVMSEIRALNSKIQIIAQRMEIMEKNEQIIGKTLISHNKTIKELERVVKGMEGGAGGGLGDEVLLLQDFKKAIEEIQESLSSLDGQVKQNAEKMEQIEASLKEAKYVLDTINPVSYVTTDQVVDLVDDRVEKALRKK